ARPGQAGVHGTQRIKLLFYGFDLREPGKNGEFEIIPQHSLPLFNGIAGYDTPNIDVRSSRSNAGKRLRRSDMNVGGDNHKISSFEANLYRIKYLSPTRTQHWRIVHKKGTVATQSRRIVDKRLFTERQVVKFIQHAKGVSAVRRSAAQPCARWDMFEQIDLNRINIELLIEQRPCLNAKVVLR